MLFVAVLAAPSFAQPPSPPPSGPPAGGVPGANLIQPNGLALPPGYRPRTPPPSSAPPAARIDGGAAPSGPRAAGGNPGAAGTVMYFQKPADALTATGGGLPDADETAQLRDRPRYAAPVPDVAPRPAPPVTRPAPPTAFQPPVRPSGFAAPAAQPPEVPEAPRETTSTSEKKQPGTVPPVPAEAQKLPPREKILGTWYNDADLEKAIMAAIVDEQRRFKQPEPPPNTLVFPPLPVVSPPGVPYQSKTAGYAPRKLLIEPAYVVHRKLHFEDQNAERGGWDLGPLSTLVSAGYFYRNVLLWPQSLVTGCALGAWDTSAGKCLPGSPAPYYLYPPNLTVTGGLAEAGIVTGFAFLFPEQSSDRKN